MSEGPIERRPLQVRLATILVFVAANCVAFAMIQAGRPELALCAAFPFAVGMIVGQLISRSLSLLFAPIVAAFAVPVIWGAIGRLFVLPWSASNVLLSALNGLIFFPGVLIYGAIPAICGCAVSRRLNGKGIF